MITDLVSVILPLYNTESFIDKAITSIVDQKYTNWELLICDDGSTDKSLDLVKSWELKEPRIKVFVNSSNRGYLFTYNFLLQKAEGEFIMVQDSDDWSDRSRMAKQIAVLRNKQVDFCLCNSVFYSPEGKPTNLPKQQEGLINLSTPEHWAPATVLFRSTILQSFPGFNIYFDRLTSMDRYFLLEMLSEFKGYYLEEYLYFVQERSDSDHRSIDFNQPKALKKLIIPDIYLKLKEQRIKTGTDWLKNNDLLSLHQFEQELYKDKIYLAEKIRNLATNQIWYKNYKSAFELMKESFKMAPLYYKNYRTLLLLLLTRFNIGENIFTKR